MKNMGSLFVISALTTSNIRNWIRVADMDQLEMVVLEGQVIFIKIDNKYQKNNSRVTDCYLRMPQITKCGSS